VSKELEDLLGQIERGEVKSESGIFILPSLSISQREMDEAFAKAAAELGMTLQEAREAIERNVAMFKKKARDGMN
jgi:predicted nucleotide-binding protein (sugar kinase/HSP70/actin superfamily)